MNEIMMDKIKVKLFIEKWNMVKLEMVKVTMNK
jgi:hypothetical protein